MKVANGEKRILQSWQVKQKNTGANFKYEYSYEEIGLLLQKFVTAWRVEIEKYFLLVLFNFLFSNGDAHLKIFSLLESSKGDYLLSPAYYLANTRLHVDDTDFALYKGPFVDDFKSDVFKKSNHVSKADFIELAKRIGVATSRIEKLLTSFLKKQSLVEVLIPCSFLSDTAKREYMLLYNTKRNYLNA